MNVKQRLLAWKLKQIAYISFSGRKVLNVTINHFRAEFFLEQAMPTGLEIEEVLFRLRLVLRGNDVNYLRCELIYKVINLCFRENLVQIYF